MGLGCMGMSFGYGLVIDKQEMILLLCKVVDFGVIFFDIVEVYGFYINEELLGEVLVFLCDKVVIVIKFGFQVDLNGGLRWVGLNS